MAGSQNATWSQSDRALDESLGQDQPTDKPRFRQGTTSPSAARPSAGQTNVRRPTSSRGLRRSWWVERALLRRLLEGKRIDQLRFVLWDGAEIATSQCLAEPVATVLVRDRATLWRLAIRPELGFGDAYASERLEVEGDLVTLLEAVSSASRKHPTSGSSGKGLVRRWRHRNSLRGSRHNIHRHYDLGNDFYRLWLDDDLLYTCAYYPHPDASLEEAQRAKMEHVCRKLRLHPGERVVEAGSGWGALALYMAREHGVTVRSYNISREQVAYARQRARAEGLEGRVEFVEDDYRSIQGGFDVFVSVGMLEHVGKEHYRDLGKVLDRALLPHGRALVHSIGRARSQPLNAWIESRIFPGAYPPTLREMMQIFEPEGFAVIDVENLRPHYAQTLRHWLERYEASIDQVRSRYGERFVRAWRLYLSGSIAAFTSGTLELYQVLVSRAGSRWMPKTRDDLYRDVPYRHCA